MPPPSPSGEPCGVNVSPPSNRIGEWLVARGHLPRPRLEEALREHPAAGLRLAALLVSRGWVDPDAAGRALADLLSLEFLPAPFDPEAGACEQIDEAFARRHRVLPLHRSAGTMRVAMVDPLDDECRAELRFRHGCETEVVVVTDLAIEAAFDRCWGGQIDRLLASIDPPDTSSVAPPIDAARPSAPIIRLVDHLIDEAVAQGASDIHLGPVAGELRVRMRIDGVLRERHRVGEGAGRAVVSRIKIMAGMDIAIQRRPQDGGLNRNTAEGPLALRVSCLPCEGGEKVVIRILDPRRSPGGLTALGLASDDHRRILGLLERAQGVVLVAGPTGSGKSSTLQAALRELDRSTLNVVTLEDPVEHRVPGVTHVQVHPRSGLTFPTGLRAVLRQDPDVLMIGEIRDRETAEIAMNAAITGHLVLSTIHTTDAPGAIARLRHMGVPAHLVAGGLSGVIAQRLVRRTCTRCSGRLDRECPACIDGLRGRTGIFQVLEIDDRQREAIASGASLGELRRLARRAGAGTLADDAQRVVGQGRTTLREVSRLIRADAGSSRICRHCSAPTPADASGCPWCGGAAGPTRCACGHHFESGWRWCPWCRRRRSAADPTQARSSQPLPDLGPGPDGTFTHPSLQPD